MITREQIGQMTSGQAVCCTRPSGRNTTFSAGLIVTRQTAQCGSWALMAPRAVSLLLHRVMVKAAAQLLERGAVSARELPEDAEPLRLDPQRHVELAAEVLQRDGGGQLHDLRLAEVLADAREEVVGDALAGDGHGLGVGEGVALDLIEERAGGVLLDGAD